MPQSLPIFSHLLWEVKEKESSRMYLWTVDMTVYLNAQMDAHIFSVLI